MFELEGAVDGTCLGKWSSTFLMKCAWFFRDPKGARSFIL